MFTPTIAAISNPKTTSNPIRENSDVVNTLVALTDLYQAQSV